MAEFRNTVLRNLDAAVIERLHLTPLQFEREHTFETPGEEIRHLYFIESGIGSMTTTFEDGSQIEVGMFGWESVIGAAALMGTRKSLNNIYMQSPGNGYAATTEAASKEFQRGGRFHDLVLRYTQAQLMQASQSAACNAFHPLQKRLARWLLLCHDRAESDVMNLTQEFLSYMLGVQRSTVSLEAEQLQHKGAISYNRAKVRIADRPLLESLSCECYAVLHEHLNNYDTITTGFGA